MPRVVPCDAFALAHDVRERLSAQVAPGATVLGPLDLGGDPVSPHARAICVLPAAEQPAGAGPDAAEDGPGQALVVTTRVLHVTRTRNVRGGGDAAADLEMLRVLTRASLAGWVPPCGGGLPLQLAGGRLVELAELREGRAWWADDYRLTVWLPHAAASG